MINKYFSLLDMAIVGVPVLAIGFWQLVSVNREIARDKAKREADSPESALFDAELPESSGHPVGEHRLDAR